MSWLITGSQKVNWDPSLISTALWLDAADASTITESSGAVSQWNDKSGNNRNAAQATPANRPAYSLAAQNGKNTVLFSVSNSQTLLIPSSQLHSGLYSVFTVAKAATATAIRMVISQDSSNRDGQYLRLNNATTAASITFNTAGSSFSSTATVTATNWNMYSAIREVTEIRLFANGTIGTSAAVTGTAKSTSNSINIGSTTTTGAAIDSYFDGDIGEIIFVGSAVDTSTRQRVEGYLAHKWGLAANLPSNHPYKVNVPTP